MPQQPQLIQQTQVPQQTQTTQLLQVQQQTQTTQKDEKKVNEEKDTGPIMVGKVDMTWQLSKNGDVCENKRKRNKEEEKNL